MAVRKKVTRSRLKKAAGAGGKPGSKNPKSPRARIAALRASGGNAAGAIRKLRAKNQDRKQAARTHAKRKR